MAEHPVQVVVGPPELEAVADPEVRDPGEAVATAWFPPSVATYPSAGGVGGVGGGWVGNGGGDGVKRDESSGTVFAASQPAI